MKSKKISVQRFRRSKVTHSAQSLQGRDDNATITGGTSAAGTDFGKNVF